MPPSPGGNPTGPDPLAAAAELLAANFLRLNGLVSDAADAVRDFATQLTKPKAGTGGRSPAVPTGRDATGGLLGMVAAPITAVVGLIGAKVIALLAPVAVLAAAVSAETSGFTVFLSTLKLAAAVLGTLLTPFFALAGAAVLTLADAIASKLLPNLEEYYTYILTTALTAMKAVTGVIDDVIAVARALAEAFDNLIPSIPNLNDLPTLPGGRPKEKGGILGDILGPFQPGAKFLLDQFGGLGDGDLLGAAREREAERQRGAELDRQRDILLQRQRDRENGKEVPPLRPGELNGGAAKEKGGAGSFLGDFVGNLKIFSQELRQKSGPQAQSTGIVEAAKRAQLAALNQSPIEAKMLDIQTKMLEALERSINKLQEIADKQGVRP